MLTAFDMITKGTLSVILAFYLLPLNTHIVFSVCANFTESRFNLKNDKIIKLNPIRTI